MKTKVSFNVPRIVVPGDAYLWLDTIPGADLATDELSYSIRGEAQLDVFAIVSGGQYASAITSADSESLTPGSYYWQAYLTAPSGRRTLGSGQLQVAINLADTAIPFDGRSQVQRHLDAVEAAITARLGNAQVSSYSIKGRNLQYTSLDELFALRSQLRFELSRGQEGFSDTINIKFRQP